MNDPQQQHNPMRGRLHQLDSLRGLAALSVMLSHVFLVFPQVWDTRSPEQASMFIKLFMFSPLRVVWAGHEAVIFFFILSGFVLALLFFGNSEPQPYRLYLTKRILRIYPPYLAAALLAIGLRELIFIGSVPHVSGWFNQSWQSSATVGTIMDHILMVGSFNNCAFNPVLWSLVHEMRISIVFPLIIWVLVRHEKLSLILPVAFTSVYWLSITLKFRGVIAFEHDYFATLHYTGFFIVGAWLSKHRLCLISAATRIHKWGKWLILCGAIGAYSNAFWLPHYGTPQTGLLALLLQKSWFQEWITALGVIVIIVLSLSSKALSSALAFKPLQFLGSISYSLYLFHALVLKVLVTLLSPIMPLPLLLSISIVCALLVSTLSWRYIEIPCIELSKFVTKRWLQKTTRAKCQTL